MQSATGEELMVGIMPLNFARRNESGYNFLLADDSTQKVIQSVGDNFAGDSMISKQRWRVQESLKPDGWRGAVEN